MAKFPNKIFVKIEKAGTDGQYILADENAFALVDTGDTVELGEYVLTHKLHARGVVELYDKEVQNAEKKKRAARG